jgi:hypothetical protein
MKIDFFKTRVFKEVYDKQGDHSVKRIAHYDMRRILIAYSAMDIMLTLNSKSPIKHVDMDFIVPKSIREEALFILMLLDYIEETTWKGKEAWKETSLWKSIPITERINKKTNN